ncbi:uncharacterized protein EDB93DRAFT_60794 [Suillus bovinus]|uniref:uncharacterized protein n=1 Tax=Suillus bovinus TaxID=48563 RepID=UPI001B87C438|nr:uncharacterized protein EDB93DRAFT_60794 [Suillus bovinus]KAG2155913.1 hypothetical protein EDB93DRAFT_60794 [Suillus bovinus]
MHHLALGTLIFIFLSFIEFKHCVISLPIFLLVWDTCHPRSSNCQVKFHQYMPRFYRDRIKLHSFATFISGG